MPVAALSYVGTVHAPCATMGLNYIPPVLTCAGGTFAYHRHSVHARKVRKRSLIVFKNINAPVCRNKSSFSDLCEGRHKDEGRAQAARLHMRQSLNGLLPLHSAGPRKEIHGTIQTAWRGVCTPLRAGVCSRPLISSARVVVITQTHWVHPIYPTTSDQVEPKSGPVYAPKPPAVSQEVLSQAEKWTSVSPWRRGRQAPGNRRWDLGRTGVCRRRDSRPCFATPPFPCANHRSQVPFVRQSTVKVGRCRLPPGAYTCPLFGLT